MVTSHQETPAEEIANSITHALALALSCLGMWLSWHRFADKPISAWSTCLFSGTLALLYLFSASYHACPWKPAKTRLQRLDHGAIFLFIAGSYTPFCLFALPDHLATSMLLLVWTLALAGSLFSLCGGTRFPTLSMLLMLGLGWMAVAIVPYLHHGLSGLAFLWLVGGGCSYTVGSLFFATHFFRFSHAVWHLFVMLGSACHYVSIWLTAQNFPT